MYRVTVYPDLVGEYFAEFYAGLYELCAVGLLELRFAHSSTHRARAINNLSPFRIKVEQSGNQRPLKICFDPADWHDIASMDDLEEADVYFKRSYHAPYIDQLDENLRKKVLPMGMHYACRSHNEPVLGRLKLLLARSQNGSRGLKRYLKALLQVLGQPTKLLLTRYGLTKSNLGLYMLQEDFEVPPGVPAEPRVFYRTRVYSPQQAKDSFRSGRLDEINEMRVNTVRALRENFGDRFVGGLRRTSYVEDNYPDEMYPDEIGLSGHIELSKRCLVNVTTDGLHYSLSWKFPEYMAASRCIVSEPVGYSLPVAPEPGRHYLPFNTPKECVSACQELLDDTDRANRMREENFLYYQKHVMPERLMARSIETAFSHSRAPNLVHRN